MIEAKPNIELLKRLRTRFLRMRHAEHFNMDDYARKTECGTAMCIAGHALVLQGYRVRGNGTFVSSRGLKVDPHTKARDELGLTNCQANDLFYDFDLATPKDAAARIQELIEEYQR
jgi:hypothetical protein